ncbi:MAG: GIY-YIG nuclease family protein [Alphaproteobacteria bacterium]
MLTNRRNGALYVGVTNHISRRTREHRRGTAESFTKLHNVNRLVYIEEHLDIEQAILR